MAKPSKVAERLAVAERELRAAHEWFLCAERPDCRNAGPAIEVEIEGGERRIIMRGVKRASGGVAVMCEGPHRDFPVYVDDLLARLDASPDPYLRSAAARARARVQNEVSGRV